MAEQLFYSTTLCSKALVADGVYEFHFSKPADFIFRPGQFVQFQIPDGEKHVLRSYSIASTPRAVDLHFLIKLRPGGKASAFFETIQVGDMATISTPKGRFVCEGQGPKYFIATGTGLAPVMSMVTEQVESPVIVAPMIVLPDGKAQCMYGATDPDPVTVLFGVRSEKDIFWKEQLEKLQEQGAHFSYTITLSQPTTGWEGETGRVTAHVKPDPNGHYFLCGNLEMVKDVRSMLVAAGVPTGSVHFEIF